MSEFAEKDQNQGTLVVFNLDPAVTNEELRYLIFVLYVPPLIASGPYLVVVVK